MQMRHLLAASVAMVLSMYVGTATAQSNDVFQVCVHKQTGAMRKAPSSGNCLPSEVPTALALPGSSSAGASWYDANGNVAGAYISRDTTLVTLQDDAGNDVPVSLTIMRDTPQPDSAAQTYRRSYRWAPAVIYPVRFTTSDCTGTPYLHWFQSPGADQPTARVAWLAGGADTSTPDLWVNVSTKADPAYVQAGSLSYRYPAAHATYCTPAPWADFLVPVAFSRHLTALHPPPLTAEPTP